jgi:hypothetical protein
MQSTHNLDSMSDDELLRRLVELLHHSRGTEADLVAHVGEVDARRLYTREAAPSMYAYCTEVLHLSEAEAYLRIAAGRASREHPVILEMLADGRLHLSAIAKLAPHLTAENREALLKRATHKSKRQVEELVAELDPRPDITASMRKLPERRIGSVLPSMELCLEAAAAVERVAEDPPRPDQALPAESALRPGKDASSDTGGLVGSGPGPRPQALAVPRPAVIEPLAPARYRVQFTASAELRGKLERLRALMRSSVPDGDLAAIIEQAVTEKLERLEARRFGRAKAPRKLAGASSPPSRPSPKAAKAPVDHDEAHLSSGQEIAANVAGTVGGGRAEAASGERRATTRKAPSTRHVPAAVRRAVHERDGGRCRYVDAQGRRCSARERLEFHHRHPFGFGGDHSVEQISLVCKAHNRYLAEVDYGRQALARRRVSRSAALPPDAPPSP